MRIQYCNLDYCQNKSNKSLNEQSLIVINCDESRNDTGIGIHTVKIPLFLKYSFDIKLIS